MYRLTVVIEGNGTSDLAAGLAESQRKVEQGITSFFDGEQDGNYRFRIDVIDPKEDHRGERQIAIAIDTNMLAANGSSSNNPYICSVPTGLTAQEILELVYREVIEDDLEENADDEDGVEENADDEDGVEENADDGSNSLPDYDYLWHGSAGADGAISGGEWTS
jgi:hypothetical protein